MNLLRKNVVQQVNEIDRLSSMEMKLFGLDQNIISIPEIRQINENQAYFDEKLYALTRIESIRMKDTAM